MSSCSCAADSAPAKENPLVLHAADTVFLASQNYHFQLTKGRQLQDTPHSHDFFEIIVGLDGTCIHRINHVPMTLSPSVMHILRPGDSHSFHDQSAGTNLMVLSVTDAEFRKYILPYGKNMSDLILNEKTVPVLQLNAQNRYELSSCLDRITVLDSENKLSLTKIITGKILQFVLLDTIPILAQNVPKRFLEAVEQMSQPENLTEGVSAFLRLSNYSRPQLCRIMRNYADMTPQQYVLQLRMNKAYELLMYTEHNQQTIAEMVGFSSLSHFSKIFHQYFGVTPASVRKASIAISI